MGVEIEDQQFKELCELIDEDRSGDIDYQEFANADVMGSRLFKARSVQGNSGASTVTQLQYKRGQRYKCTRPCRRMLKWLGEKLASNLTISCRSRFSAATARSRTTARTSTTSDTCTVGSRASLASGLTTRHSQQTTPYRPLNYISAARTLFLIGHISPIFARVFPPFFAVVSVLRRPEPGKRHQKTGRNANNQVL
jgi:hypothetical protein